MRTFVESQGQNNMNSTISKMAQKPNKIVSDLKNKDVNTLTPQEKLKLKKEQKAR
jgi:hypothetical protein